MRSMSRAVLRVVMCGRRSPPARSQPSSRCLMSSASCSNNESGGRESNGALGIVTSL